MKAITMLVGFSALILAAWIIAEIVDRWRAIRRWPTRVYRRLLDAVARRSGREGPQGWWVCRKLYTAAQNALWHSYTGERWGSCQR